MKESNLLRIDNKLANLDSSVDAYFEKYKVNQFSQVLRTSNFSDPVKSYSTNENMIEQIEVCNRLWIINGLLKELDVFNDDDIDLASVIANFGKLTRKYKELNEFLANNGVNIDDVNIIKEMKLEIAGVENKITDLLKQYFKNYFVFDNDLNLTYNFSYKNVEFGDYLKQCERFSNNDIMTLFDLRKVFVEWTEESLSKIENGYDNEFKVDDINKCVKLTYKRQPFELTNYFSSIKNYITLFDFFVVDHKVFQFVKFSVSKILLVHLRTQMFSKENISQLLIFKYNQVENSTCVDQLREISVLLSKNQWSPDNHNDLEFWIDDLQTFYIDSIVDKTIDEFKSFIINFHHGFYETQLNKIITKDLTSDSTNENGNSINEEVDWNDEWDKNEEEKRDTEQLEKGVVNNVEDVDLDDDAWNEQIDLDLDDEEGSRAKVNGEIDDDGWDAWDDENVDLRLEDEELQIKVKSDSTVHITSYKYTTISDEMIKVIEKYYSNIHNFKGLISETALNEFELLIKHNIKKLVTSLFMMIQFDVSKTYKNEILFYNDFTRVLESCYLNYNVELTSIFKLSLRYINNHLNSYFMQICELFNEYDRSIWNDNATNFKKGKIEFLIRFNNSYDETVRSLEANKDYNTQLISNTTITLNFKIFNILCEKILSRNDISSEESVMFEEIIAGVISIIQQHYNVVKIQSFKKIEQVSIILSSTLKEIMQRFYNAEFYEMETFELINLIKALFVDSSNRDDVLHQIQSVRNAQLE